MRSEYTDRNIPVVLENYQIFENEADELVHVFVNGEEIITTPSHPFYVPKLGWTFAVKLRAGDILVLSNGEYVVVEAVQHEILESPVKVYNFEVEDFHTYFVGESSVLVHNDCKIDCAYLKEKYHDHIFSNDHIKNGIMDLGNSEDEIMNSGLDIIRDIDRHGLLQEGSSQIWTHINGFDVEIRAYVKQGQLISFDMLKNWFKRKLPSNILW